MHDNNIIIILHNACRNYYTVKILYADSLTIATKVSIAVAVVMFALLVILVFTVTVIVMKYYKKGMSLHVFVLCIDSSGTSWYRCCCIYL